VKPSFLKWISGGFFIEKHLTQGDFSLLNSPPPSGEIVNFTPPYLQSPWLAKQYYPREKPMTCALYEQYLHGNPLVIEML